MFRRLTVLACLQVACLRPFTPTTLGYQCRGDFDCAPEGKCISNICTIPPPTVPHCTSDDDCTPNGQCIADICKPAGAFSLRGAYFRPWRDTDWPVSLRDSPTGGAYATLDPPTLLNQSDALAYGNIDFAISTWFGSGTNSFDAALRAAVEQTNPKVHWTIEYANAPVSADGLDAGAAIFQLQQLLDVAASPQYLRIHGKWVIFVDAQSGETCTAVQQWADVATSLNAFIVQQVFSGDAPCLDVADGWHQRAATLAIDTHPKTDGGFYAVGVSPGFWEPSSTNPTPELVRDLGTFETNVATMVADKPDFQLVTTFNEWSADNAVESGGTWESDSGFGAYLDVLHNNPP